MTDSCVYILGQSRSRGGLAREARQGAASREKAKVANLIKYTETKTETNARYKVANSRNSLQESLIPQPIVWYWNKKIFM